MISFPVRFPFSRLTTVHTAERLRPGGATFLLLIDAILLSPGRRPALNRLARNMLSNKGRDRLQGCLSARLASAQKNLPIFRDGEKSQRYCHDLF